MTNLLRAAAAIAIALAGLMPGQSAAVSCLEKGGNAKCTAIIPLTDWSHSLCDDWGAYVSRQHAWCDVLGGTWNPNIPGCEGVLTSVTDGNAVGLATQFEQRIHDPNCFNGGPPPGACSNWNCACQVGMVGNVVATDFTPIPFNGRATNPDGTCSTTSFWAENVIHERQRVVGCPPGYALTTGDDGQPACMMPAPCEKCMGDPIEVSSGQKRIRDQDYASPAPGGPHFERQYNSGGFFDLQSRYQANTDLWRHNYSAYIVPYTGNAYVMAAAVRPSGVHRFFNVSGVEMHNVDGAAYRLQKLTDGGGNVTGWRLTTDESDVEAYDAQGRLSSITTRAGLATTLAYNAQGQLETVTDPFGRSLTLGYDAAGRLATLTDPSARTTQYGYDSVGRLVTVTHPDATVRTYVYEVTDRPWLLTGVIDERGVRHSSYAYDSSGSAVSTELIGPDEKWLITGRAYGGQVVYALDGFNQQHTFYLSGVAGMWKLTQHQGPAINDQYVYDAAGNRTKYTDLAGVVTAYSYDLARNLETTRTEGYGTSAARTIATTWHPTFRLPATITEPSGVSGVNLVTEFTYDAAGNLTKKKLTAGSNVREWNYTVNARGQVLTIDGPRTDVSDVTAITYYPDNDTCTGCRGQVQTMTNALGQVTTFGAYDADGRPTQITDPNGVVTTLTYNVRGWLASRTVGGETTAYDYDAAGNLSKVTLPDGGWIRYAYDAANGLIGLDDSLGNAIDYVLDVRGNRVQENAYDPQGRLKRTGQWLYDYANRLQKTIGAEGQTTTYGYAAYNNYRAVSDPLLHVTTAYNDGFGRVTSVTDAANGNTYYTYDAKDRLTSVKDPRNLTTTYTYNGLGDLLTQVSPDTGTTTFAYNAAGSVTTQTDARSVATTYTYDALNRVLAATVTDGTVAYEYDNATTGGPYARGRLTKVTDPSGNTTWAYDALGRVTAKTQTVAASPADKTLTLSYNYSQGRQTGIVYPSGRSIVYGFNAQGQVSSIAIDGAVLLSGGEYFPFGPVRKWLWGNGDTYERSFDLDGRVKSVTLGPSTGTYADLSQGFAYDSLDRLTSATVAAGQALGYAYDANGNRTSTTVNGGSSTTYSYPGTSHRLSALSGASSRSFTYDAAGNVTASAGITYVYDGRGRLKQAGSATYLVNGLGQRVKKTAGADTFFAYDEAGHLLGEYDASGAPIQETVWLGDLPVATIRPKQPTGYDVYYVWADNLGSPRAVSDAANQLRWTWDPNDPFGKTLPNENPAGLGAFAFNLRFPGQYFDQETGTHFNWMRDYDPSIGRYIESDPIGLAGGLNTFGYVDGSPLRYLDFTGEAGALAGAAGGACAVVSICMFIPSCKQGLQNGTRSLLQALSAMAGSGDSGSSSGAGADAGSGSGPQACSSCPPPDPCDKKLSNHDVKKLQKGGINVHEEKDGFGGPPKHFDLYKCKNGDVVVKRKGGGDIVSRTGLNINNF